MRSLRAMLVLIPMLAFAGWHQAGTVTPPVSDVYVVDAGVVFAVSSNAVTAWHVSDAGVSTPLNSLAGAYIGGGFFGTSCLMGMTTTGGITPSPGCGAAQALGSSSWTHFRLLTGQPFGVAVNSLGSTDTVWSGPGAAAGWASQGVGLVGTGGSRSLQTGRVGGLDYAVANSSNNGIRVSVDGGAPGNLVVTGTSGLRDAAPFPLAGAPAVLGTLLGGGLALWRDYRTPMVFNPTIPAGTTARFVGISGVTGMATTAAGGLISPIPDPNRPVEVWVSRPTPPAESFTGIINCIDDRFCATANVATGLVWFWANEVAPQVSVSIPQFDAGQTIRLFADAGDGDGDPIYVSWSVDGGALVPVAGIDDGTQVDFTVPGGACGVTTVDVTVTDGLPGHARTIQVPISVVDRGSILADAGAATALAGGPPVDFTASLVGGCSVGSLSWSTNSDTQTGTGGQFSWTPPLTECTAGGRLVTVTTTSTWSSGVPATTSASQVITVLPWGTPTVPLFASPGAQPGGSVRDWQSSGAEHVCSTSPGFPGTELIWTFDAGAQYTQSIDGGLRITAPPTCVPLRVSGSARRQVSGEDAGRISAPGELSVDILPDTAPLGPSTPFSMTVEGDGGLVFGELDAGASCIAQRLLAAEVIVSSGGTELNRDRFSTPGGWQLSIPGGCSGGTYDVLAQLLEDGGFTGATAMGSVSLAYSPARIGTLSVNRVDVACGVGAKLSATVAPAADSCGSVELTWRVASGPVLVTPTGSGATLDLQSQALDFSTVGQQLVLEFAADAGPGNLALATRTIELGVQPFLEATVRAQPPLRREEEPVSLEVTLRNTTACAVEGLSVTLPLSGGSPLLDSVLVDQVHATATQTDQGVVVEGVSVPASGSVLIQLRARAQLLNSPTVEPVASLRGYVVSSRPPTASPATGCGCSELASPAFLALALLVLRRRKRSTG